ncbi:hypothetical protein [Tenacibaculum amylolyticum]|uniref:hypothetical protein n=1 Tax=Tenacibaculum amylolyticum TaxID=104269 RepID=UPI003895DE21
MIKKVLSSILFFLFLSINAQKRGFNNSYINYFQNTREVPFLQLNKTTFLQGEEIWFKAYIQEQNSQKLHSTTSNLYVSIFDESGELKDQQLIHIKNGMGNGNILLDSTFTNSNYYIKASTRWMKNFEEDNAFYQKIKLASTRDKEVSTTIPEEDFFEFKLFPEGGHIIANTLNSLGILIKDSNNKGIKIQEGLIKDQDNKVIRKFSTNKFGMNSVRLFFKENSSYTFHAYLSNGSEIKVTTPKPKKQGISLIVNNKSSKEVVVNLVSNHETLQSIAGKKYNVLVHNTRNFTNYPFVFKKNNLNHALVLQKSQLGSGINIITVFNEKNTPIAERLIFNYSDNLFYNLNIQGKRSINDSLQIGITNPTNEKIYASASFLPHNTIAYQPTYNIVSSFLLKPYVKGTIQNPSAYFKGNSKKQQRNLDLLLLTQGWSKYNWHTIFNSTPRTIHPFENGIDITAKVNKGLTNKQSILLYSRDNNMVRILPPKEQPWVIKNSFIKKNSVFDFALKSNDNLYKIRPVLAYSNNKMSEKINLSKLKKTNNKELEVANFKPLDNEFEALDEIEIQAKKRKKFENSEKVYGAPTILSRRRMEDMIVASGETIIDYIKSRLYKVSYDNSGNLQILPRGLVTPSGPKNAISTEDEGFLADNVIESSNNSDSKYGRPSVRVYLDGAEISDNLFLLEGIYLNTVKEVFYGRSPGRIGEEIHVFTVSPGEYEDKRAEYTHVTVPVGFATAKEYYNPKYPSFTDATYQKYGAIFWNPNISIAPNGKLDFNIPTNMQKHINIYIEGISESGKLISKKIIIAN